MSAIKKGDLVMVVRPPRCGCPLRIGYVFVVGKNERGINETVCPNCGDKITAVSGYLFDKSGKQICRDYRCIKIDPPALTDETETRKEVTA